MNITITADDEIIKKVRKIARAQGTSLQALIRRYLESVAGTQAPEALAEELVRLFEEQPGTSGGQRVRREDAYEGRS